MTNEVVAARTPILIVALGRHRRKNTPPYTTNFRLNWYIIALSGVAAHIGIIMVKVQSVELACSTKAETSSGGGRCDGEAVERPEL